MSETMTRDEFMTLKGDEADLAMALADKIAPLLHGYHPVVQSAAVADLAARWIAGWTPQLRELAYREHCALITRLVGANERAIFGEAGHPGGRD